MKVLVVAMKYLPASGGSATYAHNLAAGLIRKGHDVLLLAPSYRRTMDDQAQPFSIRRMRWTSEGFFGFRILAATIQILWHYFRFRPEVLWATTYAGCRALAPLWFLRAVHIGTIHGGGLLRNRKTSRWLSRMAYTMGVDFVRSADAVVTVSREAQNILRTYMEPKLVDEKTLVIYNGISFDRERFVNKPEALERWPEFRDKTVILTVGRLVKAKGHDLVLKALAELRPWFPELVYVVVGEGPERKNLEAMTTQLNLKDRVVFAGYAPDEELEVYYGLSDLFVMSGRPTREFIEGFGLVFIEAGVRGKAVVGTNVGGIPEAIDAQRNGVVIEPERPDLLAKTIAELLMDRGKLKAMGREGTAWVERRFTLDIMADHNDRVIRKLTEKDPLDRLLLAHA